MFTDQALHHQRADLTDSLLLTVSKQAVLTEIEADSRFALRMLAGISRRLHGLVQDVEAYALRSGVQRVVGYLLRNQAVDDSSGGEASPSRCR
jgi:CRP-like cAMP-binding protein